MTARIIDGKALAQQVRARIADDVTRLKAEHGIQPGLAAVLVGEDPASKVYVGMKHRATEEAGMLSRQVVLPSDTSQADLEGLVDDLNADEQIDGILVQLPLPEHLDPQPIQELIDPGKDVDALNPYTAGRLAVGDPTFLSCTPYGVLELLDHAGVETAGSHVVIVGRSNLVGRPLSVMLTLKGRDATVTLAHSRTRDLGAVCRTADVVVAAVGRIGLITPDMVRPGAVVIDVGTNRGEDGKLVGDVDFEGLREVAGAITPVPGGVGPMTVTMLLQNTLEAARARRGLPRR
ncbi:bifunctional methylenetetrahydrofolate dehydrogenase/methenyltetrahydrofolate cyclohydrolase FolD [Egicoccus halophilus]|uniref:Bifunctional protein FolD n=1 Tax=Egicoccus halophilus TaxID=1670830 RepID=A0A8J3A633_9ACTN|nr:bifunctional methylenetetrahydrofolate dehydrogenase/methenyltetrahydrofolate cyclohydrolase FolD [Egicoccus halophilus]GGI04116.1 bifunctional protein FolD [Egicoccus halophilus]